MIFRLDLGLHDIDNAVHHLSQGYRFNIQRHFAAFNLGYIQHVIDQTQQMLAGQRNFTQVILDLLRIVRIVHGQGRHSDNGVHGGSYVVAHAGEEVLFCRVGQLRLFSHPFGVFPGRIHFRIHALQFRHLQLEKF